jgi:hypothetical protein
VLLYAAEDALDIVRRRLLGIANAAGVSFRSLEVHVITVPTLRLDVAVDRERLDKTVDAMHPRLVVLDPFVRLHRLDENVAADVAPLLAYLRALQRQHQAAVLLVHHSRKGASHVRAGQALRGSSELHAWGDSNLYLRRQGDALLLSIEQRAAASMADLSLELGGEEQSLALRVVDAPPIADAETEQSLAERIVAVLAQATVPMSWRELREACRVRSSTLGDMLRTLEQEQTITRSNAGFALARPRPSVSASPHALHTTGNGNRKRSTHDLPGKTEAGSAGVQPAKG